jgi:hypothetical protein
MLLSLEFELCTFSSGVLEPCLFSCVLEPCGEEWRCDRPTPPSVGDVE